MLISTTLPLFLSLLLRLSRASVSLFIVYWDRWNSLSLFLLTTVLRVTIPSRLLEIERYFEIYLSCDLRNFFHFHGRKSRSDALPLVERRVLRSLLARGEKPLEPVPFPRTRAEGRPFLSSFGAVNEQRSYSWHAPPREEQVASNCPADRRFG